MIRYLSEKNPEISIKCKQNHLFICSGTFANKHLINIRAVIVFNKPFTQISGHYTNTHNKLI